jgi:TM2 domain-containing membrane protein YozV
MNSKDYPNPGVAAVLSFLFTGLGQIYNGEIKKGLTLVTISSASILVLIVGAVICANVSLGRMGVWPSDFIVSMIVIILSLVAIATTGSYSIYNAYNTAKKISKEV